MAGYNAQFTTIAIESATPGTFTTIGGVRTFSGPGGQANVIDATTLSSTGKEKLIGLKDEGQLSLSCVHLPTDPGQILVQSARATGLAKNFRITFSDPDDTVMEFSGFALGYTMSGGVDELTAVEIAIEISGAIEINPT